MSERAAAIHFGVSRASVKKIMGFSVPPGYRCTAEIKRPKLEDLSRNRKRRHAAKRSILKDLVYGTSTLSVAIGLLAASKAKTYAI
ncbi:MAG: hypothetical protein U1D35_12330 [Paracoccaceae bacterium]|nr:hypothetical protein [Paracoccaceae bacterium]